MPTSPFLAPERDPAFKRGRASGGGTTYYTVPGNALVGSNSTSGPLDTDRYCPIFVDTPLIVDQLALEVVTANAGNNIRMGLYVADTNWQPVGGPLADSGSISAATTGVKTYTPGTALYLPRGRYLTVTNVDNATPAYRIATGSPSCGPIVQSAMGASLYANRMEASRVYAAFPTPGTAWTTTTAASSGIAHIVFLRITGP